MLTEKKGSEHSDCGPAPENRVYLCQVGRGISCSACCGLYNVSDASAPVLEAKLGARSDLFAGVRRDADAIWEYREIIEERENKQRPFPDFHHCAFIGLIGCQRNRAGCLLHPEAEGNCGVDFRGLSWYGGMACRTYFCRSHRQLPIRYKSAVREAAVHWHLYGLVVTETRMLACFFNAVENRLQRHLQPGDIAERTEWRQALKAFFRLKTDWAYRIPDAPGPANYFFDDALYPTPPVRYPDGSSLQGSPFNDIFRALRSAFADRSDLRAAEAVIDHLLSPFCP